VNVKGKGMHSVS